MSGRLTAPAQSSLLSDISWVQLSVRVHVDATCTGCAVGGVPWKPTALDSLLDRSLSIRGSSILVCLLARHLERLLVTSERTS
jgi:hypothetical protein